MYANFHPSWTRFNPGGPWMRWMRFSRVVEASDCQTKDATVLGSIPASSDTVESEGRPMKLC